MPSDVAQFPSSPTPPAPPVIEVTDVSKTFDGRTVLDGVSFTVRRGETLVIMGASGCGKSTLLRCLIGAHSVDSGSVKLFGKDIAALRQRDLDTLRKRYGILFQSGALFSSMSVGQNVALPLKEHTKLGGDMIDLMVKVKLELVGLREAEDRLPSEISGGMAKRAGLARAIALDPELLFYDEPTSGLDPIMTGIIDGLITDLARTMNVTSVVVTHDLQSAFRVADRMVVLNNGRIVLQGLPNEIRASQDPFVRRFIHGPTESKTVVMTRLSMERTVRTGCGHHSSHGRDPGVVRCAARRIRTESAAGADPGEATGHADAVRGSARRAASRTTRSRTCRGRPSASRRHRAGDAEAISNRYA